MDRLDCDRMFIAVMETGSFAAAALRLNTSSGQASKLVARLEQDLGVRLLNRTTRALAATEVGRSYYQRIRGILDDLETLDDEVRARSTTPRGQLRLSAPLTFGTMQLVPALNDFAARYPLIELDVSFTDRMVNLVDEGFDAAIRAGRMDDSSLIGRKLAVMGTMVVASSAYLEAYCTPAHPADLRDHVCIQDSNFRDPGLWRFTEGGAEFTMPVTGRLRYSNAEACLNAAAMGLGLANVPDFVCAQALAAGRVRRVLQAFEPAPGGIWAIYPPGRHLAAKVRLLVEFLAERFRDGADWSPQ
jgi:DNA-binding transcriptional LysR family regulator